MAVAETNNEGLKQAFLPSDKGATIRLSYVDNANAISLQEISVDVINDSLRFDNEGNFVPDNKFRSEHKIRTTQVLAAQALESILERQEVVKGTGHARSGAEIKAAEFALASMQSKLPVARM